MEKILQTIGLLLVLLTYVSAIGEFKVDDILIMLAIFV